MIHIMIQTTIVEEGKTLILDLNDVFPLRKGSFSKVIEGIKRRKYNPTFFQVIRKEHIEEIMVNTLAFFIDHKQPHRFGNRIFNVFCQAIENSLIADEENEEYEQLDYGRFSSLRTEITRRNADKNPGDKSGRLDLIINCENCIIGVEAKVRHFVKNPFDVYNDIIDTEKQKNSQENVRKVILCKRGTKVDRKKTKDWIVVNWEDILIANIEDKNDIYAPLWEGLKIAFRGEKIMNEEDLKLVADNQEDYLMMYKMIKGISEALKDKADSLKKAVESCNIPNTNIRIWGEFGEHAEPRVVIEKTKKGESEEVIENTKKSETEYVVDIIVSAKGYRFLAFDRGNSVQTKINKSLEKEGFGRADWTDLLDDKPTERALINKVPKELMEGLEKSGEFFTAKENETEKIAKIGERIYSIITKSNY